jgi:hypothetical protein
MCSVLSLILILTLTLFGTSFLRVIGRAWLHGLSSRPYSSEKGKLQSEHPGGNECIHLHEENKIINISKKIKCSLSCNFSACLTHSVLYLDLTVHEGMTFIFISRLWPGPPREPKRKNVLLSIYHVAPLHTFIDLFPFLIPSFYPPDIERAHLGLCNQEISRKVRHVFFLSHTTLTPSVRNEPPL